MAYIDVNRMTLNEALRGRLAAAGAVESSAGSVPLDESDPENWAYKHRYDLCSSPGWDTAWASAGAAGNEDPGSDPAVITDGMILSAVQGLLA